MFRARLAALALSVGLCGCVVYHCPPNGGGGTCGYNRAAPVPCNCGASPLPFGEGPILDNFNGGPVLHGGPVINGGPGINGNGLAPQPGFPALTAPPGPDRLRPTPLAQPMPSPP